MKHAWMGFATAIMLMGCQALPEQKNRTETTYLLDSAKTRLSDVLTPLVQEHSPLDGIYELEDPHNAFVARSSAIALADKTIDAQYYIWRPDTSGKMLFNDLYAAANRGVRVRLLLDDNNTRGMDDVLAALNEHTNIEVRLFNPFMNRRWRSLGYITDFSRLNRRMHNKSLIVDNQIAIIGGRNIGDEYFAAGDGMVFADLDVMTIGPVVTTLSQDFDGYWASKLSYPFQDIVHVRQTRDYAEQLFDKKRMKFRADKQDYLAALADSVLLDELMTGSLKWAWSQTSVISDSPNKALSDDAKNSSYFTQHLDDAFGSPKESILFVSPYFIPTAGGVDVFSDLKKDDVQVAVLTNSLEATDVAAVHSGYAKYRKDLLKSGIQLFELKKSFSSDAHSGKDKGLVGSSGSSLHAKTFVMDNHRIFVGSLNLDPRSAWINTEMGMVIENSELATIMAERLLARMPERAYEVRLKEDQKSLEWISYKDGKVEQVYDTEPNVGVLKRSWVTFLSWLPIEGLL